MAELPKTTSNDFVKSLFWSIVLVGLFAALVVALLFWYYRPTLEDDEARPPVGIRDRWSIPLIRTIDQVARRMNHPHSADQDRARRI
jgi:hypothetical protein